MLFFSALQMKSGQYLPVVRSRIGKKVNFVQPQTPPIAMHICRGHYTLYITSCTSLEWVWIITLLRFVVILPSPFLAFLIQFLSPMKHELMLPGDGSNIAHICAFGILITANKCHRYSKSQTHHTGSEMFWLRYVYSSHTIWSPEGIWSQFLWRLSLRTSIQHHKC